jgi:cell division GTPase FtsZ
LKNSDSFAVRWWRGVGVVGVGQAGRGVLEHISLDGMDFLEETMENADDFAWLRDAVGGFEAVIVIGGTEEKIYPAVLNAAKSDGTVVFATQDASSPSMAAVLPELVEVIARIVGGENYLINIDLADLQFLMEDGGLTAFGVGQGSGEDKLSEAARKALSGDMMAGKTGIKRLLVDMAVGPEIGIVEMQKAVELVKALADDDALIIWGHTIDQKAEELNSAKVIILASECRIADEEERPRDPLCRII